MRSQIINLAAETKVSLLQLTETLCFAYIKLNGIYSNGHAAGHSALSILLMDLILKLFVENMHYSDCI